MQMPLSYPHTVAPSRAPPMPPLPHSPFHHFTFHLLHDLLPRSFLRSPDHHAPFPQHRQPALEQWCCSHAFENSTSAPITFKDKACIQAHVQRFHLERCQMRSSHFAPGFNEQNSQTEESGSHCRVCWGCPQRLYQSPFVTPKQWCWSQFGDCNSARGSVGGCSRSLVLRAKATIWPQEKFPQPS